MVDGGKEDNNMSWDVEDKDEIMLKEDNNTEEVVQEDKEDRTKISKDLLGLDVKDKYDTNTNPISNSEHNDTLKAIFAPEQTKIESKSFGRLDLTKKVTEESIEAMSLKVEEKMDTSEKMETQPILKFEGAEESESEPGKADSKVEDKETKVDKSNSKTYGINSKVGSRKAISKVEQNTLKAEGDE